MLLLGVLDESGGIPSKNGVLWNESIGRDDSIAGDYRVLPNDASLADHRVGSDDDSILNGTGDDAAATLNGHPVANVDTGDLLRPRNSVESHDGDSVLDSAVLADQDAIHVPLDNAVVSDERLGANLDLSDQGGRSLYEGVLSSLGLEVIKVYPGLVIHRRDASM